MITLRQIRLLTRQLGGFQDETEVKIWDQANILHFSFKHMEGSVEQDGHVYICDHSGKTIVDEVHTT